MDFLDDMAWFSRVMAEIVGSYLWQVLRQRPGRN